MTAVKRQHRIRWYVWAGPGDDGKLVKIPHAANMRGPWPGYDAECSCGWGSHTGGAIRTYVRQEVWLHKVEHGEA